jgi:two-component system cell cycle sensor histidine kinase/response regulator CckA
MSKGALGHWEYDVAENVFTFNDDFYAIFHTTAERVGGYQMSPVDYSERFVHPDDRHLVGEETRKALEAEDPHFSRELEHRFLYEDGGVGLLSVRFFIVKDREGRTIRTYGINQDITNQRTAEDKLRQSESRYRTVVDNVQEGILVFSGSRRLYSNTRLTEIVGSSTAEDGRLDLSSIVHPDDLAEVLRQQSALAEGRTTHSEFEFRVIAESGGTRCIRARASPVEWLGKSAIIVFVADITERKRAEDKLRESETRYRTLFDTSTDGILITEAETKKLRYGNASICRMLGYDQHELKNLRVSDLHPENVLPEVIATFEAQSRGETKFASELPCVRKDGKLIYAEISANMMTLDGRPCWVKFYRDVTESRHMRAQLAQADRLSTMGALAAGVAHEINNPLSYVLYNLESLSAELPGLLDRMRRYQAGARGTSADAAHETAAAAESTPNSRALDQIHERFQDALSGTRRIRDIARSLGTFSRVERDEIVPVDVTQVIEAATKMCFNELKYRARLVKNYGKVPTVMASEGRLSQVFVNLLLNAAHSIDAGDVEDNEIRVRTWAEDGTVCAEISDTGKGIAQEHMERLFEPFFTTKEIGVGSGLGLSISKTIVQGYGGTITVRSEVAEGSAFLVRFPVRAEEVASAPAVGIAEMHDQVRGRILIVDDEDGVRAAMWSMLCDHDVVEASTGEGARRILESDQAFDVILCDMMMPGISGMDLHAWLSELNPHLAEQVIFVTGGAFTPRAREYLSRVDNIRLEKPFDVANFKRIVHDRIRISRSTVPK